ncbi:MAG: methylmalonyl-CoA mutase, N-terminal domain/subunit [Ferruginibacter sp.]|nr:methylmalonyl-CoA mutase, N-terminal domain/subunit [Ferruginibacter sp.]
MTDDNLELFSAFEPVSKKTWKETAIADLKGADFDRRLVWKTDEEIAVQPFYTAEDLQGLSLFPNKACAKRKWTNYVEVEVGGDPAANQFILRMMEFGVTGILLNIPDPGNTDFDILLKDIHPAKIKIAFKLHKPSPELLQRYFSFVTAQGISLANIRGFVQSDVLEEWSVTGAEPGYKELAEQLKITAQAAHFRGLMLSSHAFVNAGSGIVQECAFILNKLADTIEMLEKEGLEREQIIPQIALHLAITGDYFFEMAKIRAIRPVLSAILERYNITVPYIPILSSNSAWSKSLYDPTVNMLRNTTEAMSAILGGCDAILINPHDSTYKNPDEFSHRIALNISNLLKEESYFDKVSDPTAGAYYIETITSGLAEKILGLYKEMEASGGYIESFKKGLIQQKISASKQKKEAEIATRKKVYVGMNKYVNAQEKISLKEASAAPAADPGFPLLHSQRATKNFEWLRQRTQQYFEQMGKIPKVYLACFGNQATRNARAAFSAEFFGTAAFEIIGQFFFEEAEKGAEESAKSDADIVVICSSDAEYETGGKIFAETFKQLNKDKKLILAGYPADIIESLKQAGVDDCIHQKTNVVEFITALQNELFVH